MKKDFFLNRYVNGIFLKVPFSYRGTKAEFFSKNSGKSPV
jgi:hypothetical protein